MKLFSQKWTLVTGNGQHKSRKCKCQTRSQTFTVHLQSIFKNMEEMKNILSLIRFFPTFQHYLNVLSAVSAFKSIHFKDLIRFLGGKSNRVTKSFANTPRRKIKRGSQMCVCDNYPTGILMSPRPPCPSPV